MDKKRLFVWSLYDFANSIVQINWLLYLSQWLVVDRGLPEIWYGSVYSVVTLLLLVTSPLMGVYSDRLSKKLPILLIMSVVTAVTFIGVGVLTIKSPFAERFTLILVLGMFFISNYFYQASLVFFNALLPTLGKVSFFGRLSGWGEFANNAGLIFGIFLTFPLITGAVKIFGGSGRSHTFLPAALAFLIFATPFFLFFKERKNINSPFAKLSGLGKEALAVLKGLPKFPSMFWFLIGYYFVSDAMRTIILFFPLYFEKVLSLSDSIKAALTIFSLFFQMIGAALAGIAADKFGTKKVLLWLTFMTVFFISIFTLFSKLTIWGWVVIFAASIFMGGYFGVSKAMLIRLAKGVSVGKYFGLYNLFERFASFVAPILFGLTLGIFAQFGSASSYRLAYFATFILIILGWVFFRKIKEKDIA